MADLGLAKSKSSEKQTSLFSCLGSVSCSICLELVIDAGERSIAKLKCGHHFHLDCIGSAFNAKGLMQCPNCRCVEVGQWLYANGRCFEDHSMDGFFHEDDYEVYAGIADLFHPHEELFSDLHWSVYPSFPHQHAPVNLEGGNPPTSGYPDLVVNVLYGEHGGASSFHTCPYLASQRVQHPSQSQFLSANVPHNHEMASAMSGGVNVRGNSARTQRASVSNESSWNAHSAGPSIFSNSSMNVNYVEAPVLPRERARIIPVSGNHVHGSENATFGQPRLHRRFSSHGAGLPEVPNMTPNLFRRLENFGSSTQNGAFPTLHQALPGTRRRSRRRGFPLAPLGGQPSDFLRERGRSATWNRATGDYAGGTDGVGWNGSAQAYSWQREGPFGSPLGAYTLESFWHPYGSTSPGYAEVASSSFHENDFYGVDGPLQAELTAPFEDHFAIHSSGI